MIRIGILGAARIAPKAVIKPASLREDCIVTAVAARDAVKAGAYAAEHGIPHALTDYDALVTHAEVDLVYNALPNNRHADLSIAALEAGKAVLCEKPFAMNAAEAESMIDAAHRTGGILIEAFHYRFHPAFLRVEEIVKSGILGPLHTIEGDFTAEIPYRDGELRHTLALGGGALMDLGCYPLHMARTLADAEPQILSAHCTGDRPGVDLATTAKLAFPNDVTADIQTNMAPGAKFNVYLKADCADGSVSLTNPVHPHRGHRIEIHKDGKTLVDTEEGLTTYDYQLAHVLDVMKGEASPLTGGADAIGNMAAIDAIYTAAGYAPRGT